MFKGQTLKDKAQFRTGNWGYINLQVQFFSSQDFFGVR